ncbi:MAG: hypothetical protein HGA80_06910 [Candidatus Omnitrophica bacterium]|nr:hypothetical protein [Candidatus Omnitrophota bacterium]
MKNRSVLGSAWFMSGMVALFALYVTWFCQRTYLGNPYAVSDDARQYLFQCFRWGDPALFQGDFLTAYASALTPIGWKAVYWVLSKLMDVITISKMLPFVLCPISAVLIFLTGRKLWSNAAGAFAAIAFVLYVWHISCFSGGFPRAFGFPLAAWFLYLCACDRFAWAGWLCLLQAGFYPPVALVCGSVWLVLRWASLDSSGGKVRAARLLLLLVLGVVSLVLFSRIHPTPWFGQMYTWPDILHMREFFLGGRTPMLLSDWHRLTTDFSIQERVWGVELDSPVIWVVFVMACGAVWLALRRIVTIPAFIPIGLLSAVVWYAVSWALLLDLFLPGRLLKFMVPLLSVLLAGAFWDRVEVWLSKFKTAWVRWMLPFFICVWAWPAFLPQTNDYSGDRPLFEFIARLPADALIAGMPSDMDGVPLFSKRKAFLTEELSLPFYRAYYREVQRRALVLFSIYYATDKSELKRMCARENICYIVAKPRDFEQAFLKDGAFFVEPYNAVVRHLVARVGTGDFVLKDPPEASVVFRTDKAVVIDVNAL